MGMIFPEFLHIWNFLLPLEMNDSLGYILSFWENFLDSATLSNIDGYHGEIWGESFFSPL